MTAESVLDQLIRKMPDAVMPYRVRSNIYASAGEVDRANADANQIIPPEA